MKKAIVVLSAVFLISACGEDNSRTGLGATQDAIQRLVEQQERENQERERQRPVPRQPTNREDEAQ